MSDNIKTLYEIEEAISLTNFERKEVKRHEMLYNLAKANEVDTIKRLIEYTWSDFIDGAEKWLRINTTKDSEARKQWTQSEYILLNKALSESLGIPVKINRIVFLGDDNYGWQLHFTYNNKKFVLIVPNIQNLSVTNIEYAYYGKLAIGYEKSDTAISIVNKSYFLKDLRPSRN